MKIHGPQSPWRVRLPAGDARRLRRVAAAAGLAPEEALRLAIVSELPGLEAQVKRMKTLTINSTEGLEAAIAAVVRKRILHTQAVAAKEAEAAELEQRHQPAISNLLEEIAESEANIQDYCLAHRGALFSSKKSRETNLAEFGFELTPPRVETASKKVKWKEVVGRLLRLSWAAVYVRRPEPQPDKQALLADREKLSPEQCLAAGIRFCQDEQFFIRPKPQTASPTNRN
ncbi:MAG TPA: host-nuclease inhibitor Gam family protein [Dongiaceae bacterium]|nr:host-nuclease inhibitor Gam family protein [Dongiaceae bacterium]